MTESTDRFIKAYKKHGEWVYKPDTKKIAEVLKMDRHSVQTIISRYKRLGIIDPKQIKEELLKDEVKR